MLVTTGYGLSAVCKPLFAVATSPFVFLVARFGDRIGKGIRDPPRDAILADAGKKHRGKIFGFHRAMDTLGAVIGPLLTLLLFPLLGFRKVFLVAFLPALLATLLVGIFLKVKEKRVENSFEQKSAIKPNKRLRRFFIAAGLFALVNFSYAFFLLKANKAGLPITITTAIYLLFNIVYVVFAMPAGILADKIGKKRVIIIGYVLFALMCIGFALSDSKFVIIGLFAVYGLVKAITEGVQRAYVSDMVHVAKRGTALGMFNLVVGIAALPASIVAGLLWQINPAAPFITAAITAFVAALLV